MDFIYDLRNYGSNDKCRKRLDETGHQYYVGKPYFDDGTRDKILQLPVFVGTLLTALENLSKKRSGSTICASHDLAPIFEAALGVAWDKSKNQPSAIPLQSSSSGLTYRAKELFKQGSQMFKKKDKRG